MKEDKQLIYAPILIVEDEDDHARLIKKALKSIGNLLNDIVHINNGESAINYLLENEKEAQFHKLPTLILLDVKMPMKDGFEVLEFIKTHENLKKIPVVMLTTTSTSEDINKAMALGANDYIVKPVRFNDFTEKVNNLGYYWGIISDVKNIFK